MEIIWPKCSNRLKDIVNLLKTLVNIYKFTDYKAFLLAVEEEFSRFDRGFRSRLAEGLGVQSAFVSKVLNQSKVHFTLEQAMGIGHTVELTPKENTYLIWLVEWARAGTKDLRAFFWNHIDAARAEHIDIKNRVGKTTALSNEDQTRFYSHWMYGAAHVLSSIPAYTTVEAMAEALGLDPKLMQDVVFFLCQAGLVVAKKDRFEIGPTQLHLAKTSANIIKHHTNWRLKAIEDASNPKTTGIHYSTISSLSHKDAEKLRHELTEVIQRYVETIRPSPEETAYCFNLDFFSVIRDT
jgi:uncharacterized protein (TIGR02147 family)